MALEAIDLAALIPADLPDGRDAVAEGRALGPTIERATSLYCEEKGVGSEREWREKARAEGIPCTCMNIGLATWDDTREAMGLIYEDALSRGVRPPDRFNLLAERRMGLPKELRAQAPQETGPVLWTDRHWWEMTHTVPIQPEAADNMIGGPGSVDNVVNALQVGITCIGVLSQYSWRWPYWDDETAQLMAVLKAGGVLASLQGPGGRVRFLSGGRLSRRLPRLRQLRRLGDAGALRRRGADRRGLFAVLGRAHPEPGHQVGGDPGAGRREPGPRADLVHPGRHHRLFARFRRQHGRARERPDDDEDDRCALSARRRAHRRARDRGRAHSHVAGGRGPSRP